jgi:hypothetical protein
MTEESVSEEKKVYVRYPFRNQKVSEVAPNTNVAVTGVIVSKDTEIISFIIEDDTGRLNVITNNTNYFNELKEGQLVRVFGKTWGEGQEIELKSDIIQDFSEVDFELYKKLVL